jgi:hypothetical protein
VRLADTSRNGARASLKRRAGFYVANLLVVIEEDT